MTPLSRRVVPALLAAAVGAVGGAPAPVQAQDAATVQVRVGADDVVVRGGQAYYRDPRGRYERVVVRRARDGGLAFFRVLPRTPWYVHDPWYVRRGGGFDDAYRPPARKVACTSTGHCDVSYYDPYYDRRLRGGGYRGRDDGDRGRHRDRDRGGGDDGRRRDGRDDD